MVTRTEAPMKYDDWHDWLEEARRWYDAAEAPGYLGNREEAIAASWRCLLRWASRIEFFNE